MKVAMPKISEVRVHVPSNFLVPQNIFGLEQHGENNFATQHTAQNVRHRNGRRSRAQRRIAHPLAARRTNQQRRNGRPVADCQRRCIRRRFDYREQTV
jgi:hypothetical protein